MLHPKKLLHYFPVEDVDPAIAVVAPTEADVVLVIAAVILRVQVVDADVDPVDVEVAK